LLFGVEETWYMNDPVGRKILSLHRNRTGLRLRKMDHACYWGEARKQAGTGLIPPPRLVCAHGLMAKKPSSDDC